MSDPWRQPWSNNPDAPQLSKYDNVEEKAPLAGSFIGAVFYGTPARSFVYLRSLLLFGVS